MRAAGGHITYLNAADVSEAEREILKGFIDQRNTVRPTGPRTKGKQAYEGFWICQMLRICKEPHHRRATLDKCNVKDLLKVAGEASNGTFKKNSRQTKIMTLKVLARYINRTHHKIPNLDMLTLDVKAGAADCDTKNPITMSEWHLLINLPMPARDKAMVAMLYDGYHRPKEILILKWTDLKLRDDGAVEYVIKFKTELPRTIVQKPWTTKLLKAWAKECGAEIGKTPGPIFANGGKYYQTIQVIADLFQVLRKKTGIQHLIPSVLRNSAIKHDVDAGLPVSYVCLRAWGVTYNKMINIYMKPDSGRIQADQHRKASVADASPVVDEEEEDRIATLERKQRAQEILIKEMRELMISQPR